MGFIEFTAKKTRNIDKVFVSISKGGRIGFSQRCYADYLKDYKFVKLFYDPDNQMVGVQPTKEESSNTYAIRLGKDAKTAYVLSVAFFRYFNIDDTSRKMDARWNEKTHMLEVRELKKGAEQQTLFGT
jgi:hypothetical protein